MFLCDQVSKLRQTIDYEVKMRDGTARLLTACRGTNQAVEAAKNLLVSNIRIGVCVENLNHFKSTAGKRLVNFFVVVAQTSNFLVFV